MLTIFSYTELKPIESIVLFELIVYLFWPVHIQNPQKWNVCHHFHQFGCSKKHCICFHTTAVARRLRLQLASSRWTRSSHNTLRHKRGSASSGIKRKNGNTHTHTHTHEGATARRGRHESNLDCTTNSLCKSIRVPRGSKLTEEQNSRYTFCRRYCVM